MGKIILNDYYTVEYKEDKCENESLRYFYCKLYDRDKNISEDFCKYMNCIYSKKDDSVLVLLHYKDLGLSEFNENYDIEHILFTLFYSYINIEKGEVLFFNQDLFVYKKLTEIKKDSTYTIKLEDMRELNNDNIYNKMLDLFKDYKRLYSYLVYRGSEVPNPFISEPYSITFYK